MTQDPSLLGPNTPPNSNNPIVIALPWFLPDGKINSVVLQRMISELLLLVHLFPGISTVGLSAQFRAASPAAGHVLLRHLAALGVV